MLAFLLLVAVVALSMVLLAHYLGRENTDPAPPASVAAPTAPEQTGLEEPEWNVVMRGQCIPQNCPNLTGNPKRPGKQPGCQVCAAMFLERYGERLLKEQREGRNK